MRFATIMVDGVEQAAVRVHGETWAPLHRVDPELAGDLLVLIELGWPAERLAELVKAGERLDARSLVAVTEAVYAPPYRRPGKIWGIGLNYREHAADLDAEHPAEPASFLKANHTVIGPRDAIELPAQSQRVTAEAELGLVFGRTTRDVGEEDALDQLFGVCPVLDQTAEDILEQNVRYLTRSKNFPTFFSFGPEVVTLDEVVTNDRPLADVEVATCRNGQRLRANTIANMTHSPQRLIAFHSAMMPFAPGDLIASGTPGAVVISDGDEAEANIAELLPLVNPVQQP